MESKGFTTLTKVKYHNFEEKLKLHVIDEELVNIILTDFCETMRFDPTKKSHKPEQVKKQQEKRDALKKEGISTWISAGVKKSYEKKKLAKLQSS
jgi:hypothetical protein